MKDMDNHLQVIKHDPLARWETVNRHRSDRVILFQPRFDFVCNRFQLRLGRGRANHEEIGKRRNCAQIQDGNLFRLFVGGEFRTSFG